jgi:hypothetical protein
MFLGWIGMRDELFSDNDALVRGASEDPQGLRDVCNQAVNIRDDFIVFIPETSKIEVWGSV